jgi:putative PEP-CTERM system TPR-repeat lipoprotein
MPHNLQFEPDLKKTFCLALCALLILSACGIGVDNDDILARGQQYYDDGDYRAAIIDAKNILQDDPRHVDARLLLGRSSLYAGDPRSAEKELLRAVDLGVEKSEIIVDLGRTLLMLREYERIEVEITPEIAPDEDTRLAILRIRGDAFLRQQRAAEARAIYRDILSARNDDLDTMLAVVTSYVVEDQLFQAQETLNQLLSIDPNYVAGWLAAGSLAGLQQNLPQAEINFSKATELAALEDNLAGQIRGLMGVVEAQLAQEKTEEARLTAANLSNLAPDDPFSNYLTARVHVMDENWEAADDSLRQMLQKSPNFVPAQVMMGAVQLQLGNLGLAEAHLSSVVTAIPSNLNARKLLAEVRLQQNRADKASDLLRPLIAGDSADPGALLLAVRASLEAGEMEEAIRILQIRADSDPDNAGVQMDLAAAQMSAGDVEAAQELLRNLPIISEDDAYRREFLLVLSEVRNENFEAALTAARDLRTRWSDNAQVQNLLGGILEASGDRDAARQSFETARSLDPNDIVSLIYLGKMDVNAGNFESASALYEQALEIQPENVGVMVSLGRIAAFRGDKDDTVKWLEQARTTDETNVSSRLMLANLYNSIEDYSSAEELAREALALNPELAEAHNTLGLALSRNKDGDDAIRSFQKAIELDSNQPVYSINLAREYAMGDEKEGAKDVLFRSLKANPAHFQTAQFLAGMYVEAGDAASAMPAARGLIEDNPESVGPKVMLAELYYGNEQFDLGADLYDQAQDISGDRRLAIRAYNLRSTHGQTTPEAPLLKYIASRPEDLSVRMMLAQEYQTAGNNPEAAVEYEKVMDAEPDNFVALNNLATIYSEQGNSEAEALARKAVELAPENGAVADTLGWILVQSDSVDEGIEYLRKANSLAEGSSEIRYHLAAGLVKTGASDEARSLLGEILSGESFPSREDAEALLNSL